MSKFVDYETDLYAWALYNAQLLREGKLSELDVEHLIEELEEMGRSNRQELESRFIILIGHLLKWEYQPNHRGRSWERSIDEQRIQIMRKLRQNPSLKPHLSEAIMDAYSDALKLAAKETKIRPAHFPQVCPYTIEQLLNEDFYPE